MPLRRLFGTPPAHQPPLDTSNRSTKHTIDIVCSAYKRPGPLKVLIQCLLNQTDQNWRLHILHDTYDRDIEVAVAPFLQECASRIRLTFSEQRYHDYGHSLREIGLREVTGDYVLITNDDNYYPPRFLEFVNTAITTSDPDVVLFDMVHSHDNPGGRPLPAYSYFETRYSRYNIDMGAAVVRAELARTAGFRDKSHDGDATYFEDVAKAKRGALIVEKIPRVLLVHN